MAKRKPKPAAVTAPVPVVSPEPVNLSRVNINYDSTGLTGRLEWLPERLMEFFWRSGCFNETEFKQFYMTTYALNAQCHIVHLIDWLKMLSAIGFIECEYSLNPNLPSPVNVVFVKLNGKYANGFR